METSTNDVLQLLNDDTVIIIIIINFSSKIVKNYNITAINQIHIQEKKIHTCIKYEDSGVNYPTSPWNIFFLLG